MIYNLILNTEISMYNKYNSFNDLKRAFVFNEKCNYFFKYKYTSFFKKKIILYNLYFIRYSIVIIESLTLGCVILYTTPF